MRWVLLFLFSVLPVEAEVLRLVTFNIRYDAKGDQGRRDWRARRGLVSETILEMAPDVLGLQEVVHGQLMDIKAAHPEFDVVGVARDDGKMRGEYSPLFFCKERFRLDEKEKGTFWLSDTPEKPGSVTWGNACTRVCSWARLIDKETGKGLYVYNTHWDHRGQLSREKAAALILSRIAGRQHQMEALVLLGDFNASESSPEVKLLLADESVGLRNSFLIANSKKTVKGTFNGWNSTRVNGAMIDHVFVCPKFKINSVMIVRHHKDGQVPSDHFPVLSVCEW